jgi:dihydroflavonol-4-reductase
LQIFQSQWLTPYTSGGVSVIDVRDVVQGHLQAMEKGQTGERYILMTANYSNQEWFRLVAKNIGVAKPIIHVPDFILPPIAKIIELVRSIGISTTVDANQIRLGSKNIFFDGTKAHLDLGKPQISMGKSVQDTFLWYQENGYIQETTPSRILKFVGRLFRFE